MNSKLLTLAMAACMLGAGFQTAEAGAKLKINDTSTIDLGFRGQFLYMSTDKDLDGDGAWDGYDQWKVRRARFRLKGVVNENFSMFMQTDVSGNTMIMIDAYAHLKASNWMQFIVGQNMAPTSRQATTTSGANTSIDFLSLTYKTLNWGMRGMSGFATSTYSGSDSGVRTNWHVRDLGGTFFGSGAIGENLSMKYYLGSYDGKQAAGEDEMRLSGRVQFNYGDAEGGYYNSSNYLGKKQTIGVGFSFDNQNSIAADATTGDLIDYAYMSADFFAEQPVGSGSLSLEAGYVGLDLGDYMQHAAGSGMYVQTAYTMAGGKFQPWLDYETWTSDADDDAGSFNLMRLGVTYFLQGNNASIKLGYESFNTELPITGTEDSIGTMVLAFHTTF